MIGSTLAGISGFGVYRILTWDLGRKQIVQRQDARVDFFGRVVDDQHRPVAGAKVTLHLRHFDLLNFLGMWSSIDEIVLITDHNGTFLIRNKKGYDLIFHNIEKKGYDNRDVRMGHTGGFVYHPNPAYSFHPDPNNPVLFRLRKKGEEALVMKYSTGHRFRTGDEHFGAPVGFDAVLGRDIRPTEMTRPRNQDFPYVSDLKIKATSNPTTGSWTLVFSSGQPSGGIQARDELLYVAPASGYQEECTFTVDPAKRTKNPKLLFEEKWLYLRSRNPGIYSRVHIGEIEVGRANAKEIGFGVSFVTNPYGDRNLEEATDLPGKVYLKLDEEVRTAFERGTQPPVPNLETKIREWKASRPFSEKVKDWFRR